MDKSLDALVADGSFQARVQPWLIACFGELIAGDREERNHRFLEEALELVQSLGCTASEAHQLVDYVYGRPVGHPPQEVGGVMVTLAALCLANDLDMHAAGWVELDRIWGKVEQIRAKQAAKPKHSPLPIAPEQSTPAGMVMVPIEPTREMVNAGVMPLNRTGSVRNVWSAMLSAAPDPAKPASPTIPEGMVAWSGGDSAPEDWDGGPVLFRDGTTEPVGAPSDWWHIKGYHYPSDIIAYTRKPVSTPRVTEADIERAARALADLDWQGMDDVSGIRDERYPRGPAEHFGHRAPHYRVRARTVLEAALCTEKQDG